MDGSSLEVGSRRILEEVERNVAEDPERHVVEVVPKTLVQVCEGGVSDTHLPNIGEKSVPVGVGILEGLRGNGVGGDGGRADGKLGGFVGDFSGMPVFKGSRAGVFVGGVGGHLVTD